MMSRRAAFACLVALLGTLVLSAAPASAHAGAFEASAWLGDDPVVVEVHDAPIPVANAPMTLRVSLPERAVHEQVLAQWITPGGRAGDEVPLALVERVGYEGRVVFSETGTWGLRVVVDGQDLAFEVPVHPAGRWFVKGADELAAQGVLVAGEESRLLLNVTDATGSPAPAAKDAFAHVELWDPAGENLLDVQRLALSERGPGEYGAATVLDEPGVLRVRVESMAWGLAPQERPPVEVLVVAPDEAHVYRADEAPRETPGPALALVLGAALVGAFMAARLRPGS